MMDDRVYEKAAGKGEPWIEWGGLTLIHKDGKPIYVENVLVVEEDGRILIRPDLGAVWTARVACPQCAGTGLVQYADTRMDSDPPGGKCFADHVVMVNPHTGEEVQCDPAKAEWRCLPDCGWSDVRICEPSVVVWGLDKWPIHDKCRWVPVPEGSGEQR